MKKITLLLSLLCVAMLTSCAGNNAEIQDQKLPATEQEWANTLQYWYPEWDAPIVVNKDAE